MDTKAIALWSALIAAQLGAVGLIYKVCHAADSVLAAEDKGYCEGLGMADDLTHDREIELQIKSECQK
jgi:hypothetical protein